jgi:HD-GYP domain-containing protein (c-di-GMP phosphodiesterase class II)/DNA-binding CsgD family transcriptional regulator
MKWSFMVENRASETDSGVRLAEVVAALSLATDLGMGQPFEFALTSCILAVRIGDALGWGEEALRECYYQALLRYIGCNVGTRLLASLLGDEFALRAGFAEIDNSSAVEAVNLVVRLARGAQMPGLAAAAAIGRSVVALPRIKGSFSEHCEVAQRLAERLGLSASIVYALGQLYERWDGKGSPRGLVGESIAPAVLVVTLAQDMVIFQRIAGLDAAVEQSKERRGSMYAPHVVDCFCENAASLFKDLEGEGAWNSVLSIEPGSRTTLTNAALDDACMVLADFVDIKSPYTVGHSRAVADLVAGAAIQGGLSQGESMLLRRAALVHDIGKTGVSSAILEKAGPLTEREWEQVRLHPYYTERILSASAPLAAIGGLAALHHERLDGSGYYRRLAGSGLSSGARLLAAANYYCALRDPKAYRAGFDPHAAADHLRREVQAGRIDGDAAQCVLSAAGVATTPRPMRPAGLSDREIDVLRLLAQGLTIKQIAERLVIAPKTADHHIQNIYSKLHVSTRAAATLYAVENNLVG